MHGIFLPAHKTAITMNTILLIIDGIGLPFPVIDHVIQRAKSGGNDVIGLFIKSAEEPPVGYVFPSDIRPPDSRTKDDEAILEDVEIIVQNMHLVNSMMRIKGIHYREELFTNPSAEKIATLASTCSFVMLDANFDTKALLSTDLTLEDLTEAIIVPVIPIAG